MKANDFLEARQQAAAYLNAASIVLTDEEIANIRVTDFGLGNIARTGLAWICSDCQKTPLERVLVLFQGQSCPEHRHAPCPEAGYPGKTETLTCRSGKLYVYVDGEPKDSPKCCPEREELGCYTAFHEIELLPGDSYVIGPDVRHWLSGGDTGAVVLQTSTCWLDEYDVFSDPDVVRPQNEPN